MRNSQDLASCALTTENIGIKTPNSLDQVSSASVTQNTGIYNGTPNNLVQASSASMTQNDWDEREGVG